MKYKKVILLCLLVILIILLGIFIYFQFNKQNKQVLSFSPKNLLQTNVLGNNTQTPFIYFSGGKDGYLGGGMISLASTDEPSVTINSNNISEALDVSVYEANKDALLDYLTHDKDGKQTKKTPDISKFRFINTLNVPDSPDTRGTKVLLPLDKSGIYFLRIKSGSVSEDSFVVRSKTGAIVKEGDNEFIFWGQDYENKRSINSGAVTLYNLQNRKNQLQSSQFNGSGIATAALNSEADIAVVERDGDISIIPINLQYLNSSYSYKTFREKQSQSKYFIFTDRPIYKPGDTIYYKGVIRNDDDARYTVPSGQALVKIYSGYDESDILEKINLPISSEGTINGKYTLPSNSKTGAYHIQVSLSEKDYSSTYFDVEYYRKPEYSISVTIPQTELIASDRSAFAIEGNYFSGQPLAQQKVKYRIFAGDYYQYDYLSDLTFNLNDDYRYGFWSGNNLISGEVTLDEKGKAEINLNTKNPANKGKNQVYSVEAEFDDGSGNPSFTRKNILVYAGEYDIYYQNANSSSYYVKVGEQIKLPVQLVSHRKTNVGNIALTAKIHRTNWIPYQDPNQKYLSYRKEEEDLTPINVKTDAEGKVDINFSVNKVGSYEIVIEGKDNLDNLISKTFYSYAGTRNETYYSSNQNNDLTVRTDKQKYLPSDTAVLSITSTTPDRDIFLSLERGRVNRYQIVNLKGKSAEVEVPLAETDMPDIFAKASSFSSNNYDSTTAELFVSTDSKKLLITAIPDKKTYGPGENATINIQTTDIKGNPISVNLALWLIDKAIYEVSGDKPANIFDAFWHERYNDTAEAYSLMGITVLRSEMGGGGGDGGRIVFKDDAYWNPSLQTDSSGHAKVTFKLPDNLTTWVINAIGSNTATQVGQTENEIIVTKDIIVRPLLPNILRVGDEINISAIVQNFTDKDQTFDVSLNLKEALIKDATKSGVLIKSKDASQLYWQVVPKEENENAKITFSAKSKEDKKAEDTITQQIPVKSFGFFETRAQTGDGAKNYSISLSKDTNLDKSSIAISLSPTILGTLPQAMKYLIDYPYGCVEQTTSRFVPAVIAKNNPTLFAENLKDKNLDEIIAKSVDRLSSLQYYDGGWSWWSHGSSDPFVTSYVVEYLLQAKSLGADISDGMLKKAQIFLEQDQYYNPTTQKNEKYSPEDMVSKNYGLTLLGSKKAQKINDFNKLTPDLLSLAVINNYKNGDSNPETNGLNKLKSLTKIQGDGIYWDAGNKVRYASVDASTSLGIRAILTTSSNRDLAVKAAKYLTRNKKNVYWVNTFATAQTIRALTDLSKTGNELTPEYSYTVTLDGSQLAEGVVNSSKQNIKDIIIPANKILPQGSTISVNKTGEGQIYSSLLINEYRTDKNAKAVNHGLEVKREYISDRGEEYSLAVGDSVMVKITLSGLGQDDYYGVISDELPAGLIPINQNLSNQQFNTPLTNNYYDYIERDITQNGAILSIYQLPPLARTYTYKARVISDGVFNVPPAVASLMYEPEIYGRSNVEQIQTTKEPILYPDRLPKKPLASKINNNRIYAFIILAVLVGGIIILIKKKKISSPFGH